MNVEDRVCLVCVYGSNNILAAMAAVESRGRRSATRARIITIVHPPTNSKEVARSVAETVGRIAAAQGWPAPLLLTPEVLVELREVRGGRISYRRLLRRFREYVGLTHVDEVYYAHDISSEVPALAMNAYPEAHRITFGDALGATFNKVQRIALAQGLSLHEANARAREDAAGRQGVARSHLRAVIGGRPRPYQAESAELVLPTDMCGDYLVDKSLSVVPKDTVLDLVRTCAAGLSDLREYTTAVVEGLGVPRYMLLMENYADAGMMDHDSEVALYVDAVQAFAAKGAVVLIKPHPLASDSMAESVRIAIAAAYNVQVVPQELMRYPIELWFDLVSNCHIIVTWSYCALSLAYLYEQQRILRLDSTRINRYFRPNWQEWMTAVDRMIDEQIRSLKDWDGEGVLWRGSMQ